MRIRNVAVTVGFVSAFGLASAAQGPPPSSAPPSKPPSLAGMRLPVKVTVVLSRYQGDKRVSSMPYVLGVMASSIAFGPAKMTTLRMGVKAPVTQTVITPMVEGKPVPVQSSYSYHDVGTNIDCSATFDEAASGLFQVSLVVSDSSLSVDTAKRSGAVAPDIPSFRNFNSSFTALLRDGQTTQYTSATDPVTGEVMKIDVTLNVMK